jgi:diguanylate cyclase (GGDEF)-like protein
MSIRLLLIDDDEIDRQAVIRSLKGSTLVAKIDQSATAADGLALAGTESYDVILLDYRLPDQNGLEVLKKLRKYPFEGIAVVMLSRMEDDALAEQCLEAGAQDFLLKAEVNGRSLVRAVRQAKLRHSMDEQLKASRKQLQQMSLRDPLTGLANRRGFDLEMESAMARARRGHLKLGLFLLDLDDFKRIKDTLGHAAGDELLVKISHRLRSTVRDSDFLCRLGGDEFLVLMMDFGQDEQAVLLANRILADMQKPVKIGATEQLVTANLGIAIYGQCAESAADLLKCADVARNHAKENGKNQSCFFSDGLQEKVLFRANMKRDMLNALEKGEFKVYYQAQIRAKDGSLGGIEALLRWHHPELGILSPASFMSIAEESKLIVDIGYWVLQEACRQLKEWRLKELLLDPSVTLAVNFSAIELKQNTLVGVVKKALTENQLNANNLELEITENALSEEANKSDDILSKFEKQGVILSLGEFGTGSSSLERLKLFPISVLKIDKGFISAIGKGDKSERLLTASIAFAKALEMKVVVEGVETKEQAEFCIQNGCDLLQGYYYSHPIPAKDFEAHFLRNQPATKFSKLDSTLIDWGE